MIVDLEDVRWQALVGFLVSTDGRPYFSAETMAGEQPRTSNRADGPYYIPIVAGKRLRTGVFVYERDALVSALCALRGIPTMFLKQVQKSKSPDNMFTVVYFLQTHLGVRHVSADAQIIESPRLTLADLT